MEHEVVDDELAAPAKRSAKVSLPSGPSKTYSLSILTHGSSRRWRLTSSRNLVNSFSRVSKSLRATSHCSLDTTLEAFASVTRLFGSIVSIFIFSLSSFMISVGFFGNMTNEKRASGHLAQYPVNRLQ
jgi:hypothetical protein